MSKKPKPRPRPKPYSKPTLEALRQMAESISQPSGKGPDTIWLPDEKTAKSIADWYDKELK